MSSQPLTDLSPKEILDTALQEIQSKGIEPVEWFPLLHLRMNVPRVVMHYSFLVPDADFQRASDLLEHMGLPLQTPSEFSLLTRGDMEAKGRSHLLRKLLTFDHCLVVYPISFAAFRHYELSEQPVQYSRLHRCSHIFVPRPSAVYASLMRMMRRHPTNSSNWCILRAEMADLRGTLSKRSTMRRMRRTKINEWTQRLKPYENGAHGRNGGRGRSGWRVRCAASFVGKCSRLKMLLLTPNDLK